jgi:hypothetical protein
MQHACVLCAVPGSKSGEYEELRERVYTKLLSNGSLLLQTVKEDREGFYLCQASNGIGNGIGKVVQVKVNCKFNHIIHHKCITVQKNILEEQTEKYIVITEYNGIR